MLSFVGIDYSSILSSGLVEEFYDDYVTLIKERMEQEQATTEYALSLIADARSAAAAIVAGQCENALGEEAAYLVALMDDIGSARVTAREVRALQVAVCDAVLNVRFV